MLGFLLPVLALPATFVLPAVGDDDHRLDGTILASVVDGDTIELEGGRRVRLLQIDTPELGRGECYSRASARVLGRLLPRGAAVSLQRDSRLDDVDRYGRLLRYVFRRGQNVNVELVRLGAATVWFYGGVRGRYARPLLAAALGARRERRGLWGACRAVFDPYAPATTSSTQARATPSARRCHPSYPDSCIPPPPPDLDCSHVARSRFRVSGRDPHRFDGDRDGVGCEYGPTRGG